MIFLGDDNNIYTVKPDRNRLGWFCCYPLTPTLRYSRSLPVKYVNIYAEAFPWMVNFRLVSLIQE